MLFLTSRAPRSVDLILARRLLHRWETGGAPLAVVHRGGERRHCGAGFARGQLRLQAFEAPPSWAAAPGACDEEPPCAVCLEPVLTGRVVAGPACLHRLHEACALQLATSAGFQHCVCPTCRAPLLAVNCRAPGEAGCAAAGDEDTEEEEDEAPQRGISAQARAPLAGITSTRALADPLADAQDLELLQLLLQQAARSAGRQRTWFGPTLAPEASDGDDEDDFGSSDDGDDDDDEAEQRRREMRRGSPRGSLMRFFCRRPVEQPAGDASNAAAAAEEGAPQLAAEAGAATPAPSTPAPAERQPQCGCVVM